MWSFGRKREERVQYVDAPVGPPTNFIGLIYALSEDWGRALRAIAIISFSLIALFAAAAIGMDIILLAMRGLKGLKESYVIAPALFTGNWLVVLIVAIVRKSVTNSRAKTGDARRQPGKHGPGQIREQGRKPGRRRH